MSKTVLMAGEVEHLGAALGGITKDLPFKVSYAIAKLTREVEKELRILADLRQKLVKKYALHDEHGQPITTLDEKKQKIYTYKDEEIKVLYLKELGELLTMKVEIEHLTIPQNLMDSTSINPFLLKAIMFMFEEGKPEEKK
jgi:hypothetical protein